MTEQPLKNIIEAALLASGAPLSTDRLLALFLDDQQPSREELRAALDELAQDCAGRGIEIVEVNTGYRFQVRRELAPWVSRLWEERPQRYSRALMETLAIIAYRQPITRAEIESIRGVTVATNIVKTLQERDWIRVVGHRDVPGRPAMYATTRQFLDYFNLRSLDELPPLSEIRDIDSLDAELDLRLPGEGIEAIAMASDEDGAAEAVNDASITDNVEATRQEEVVLESDALSTERASDAEPAAANS